MSLPRGPLVFVCAVLGLTTILGAARERGVSAGGEGTLLVLATDQTPALNDERPVRMVRSDRPIGFTPPQGNVPGDALYLASPFAATALIRPEPVDPPAFARVRLDLPDGRQITLACPQGGEAQICLDAIRRALGAEEPEVTAEAHPPDGP